MPIYDFKCNECNHEFEKVLMIADYETPLAEPCPNCDTSGEIEQFLSSAPGIADSVRLGIRKPDRTFQREILGRIKKNTAHNFIGKGKFDIPGRI